MKRVLDYLKRKSKSRERQRVLDNFYTMRMKKGKTTGADILDRISFGILFLVLLVILINRFVMNLIISLAIGFLILGIVITVLKRHNLSIREKKILEIKKEYRKKLEDEKILLHDEKMEDYIVSKYYERRELLKQSIKFMGKDKIIKLYLLFIVFFIMSFFSPYSNYYKAMGVISFSIASYIGAYNFTEYLKNKDKRDLHNKDLDI
ncbi:MAG: hypothetical protein M0Q14_00855 [Tissierellaceae bacterium]|nr:hypothetical protein [Tissierellaceae bacterium]